MKLSFLNDDFFFHCCFILVFPDVPIINWVSESPHLAAKDFSDTLEVKIDNDKTLTKVDWYHNGTLIERNAEGFAFPGKLTTYK